MKTTTTSKVGIGHNIAQACITDLLKESLPLCAQTPGLQRIVC